MQFSENTVALQKEKTLSKFIHINPTLNKYELLNIQMNIISTKLLHLIFWIVKAFVE